TAFKRESEVQVFDTAKATRVFRKGVEDLVRHVTYSPDGQALAVGGGKAGQGRLALLDAAGKQVRLLRGHTGPILAAAFSPGGTRLATASGDGTIKLWEPPTGREILTLDGHSRAVTALAFDATGRRLHSATGFDQVEIATNLSPPAARRPLEIRAW